MSFRNAIFTGAGFVVLLAAGRLCQLASEDASADRVSLTMPAGPVRPVAARTLDGFTEALDLAPGQPAAAASAGVVRREPVMTPEALAAVAAADASAPQTATGLPPALP